MCSLQLRESWDEAYTAFCELGIGKDFSNILLAGRFSASLNWPHLIEIMEQLVDASLPKIRRLRATPVNVPLARPHPTASGVVNSAPLVLMDLETDQGLTGHAYVFCYTPIALKPIAELIEALQPLIQGDAVAPLVLAQKLQGRFRLLGPQGFTGIAMAAIDMAAWDVLAKSAGLSLTRLLGGEEKPGSGLPQPRHGWAGRGCARSSRIDRAGFPVREV
jgi:hypothetical protein